ncbi:MAG: hypothetical protein AAF517_23445, partial [Planctomycetota bacterium]
FTLGGSFSLNLQPGDTFAIRGSVIEALVDTHTWNVDAANHTYRFADAVSGRLRVGPGNDTAPGCFDDHNILIDLTVSN